MKLSLSENEFLTAVLEAQDHFGFSGPEPIEKDFHIVKAIAGIARVQHPSFKLVFAGGTALARAHKIVKRMSEDVDFKVVPVVEGLSRSAIRNSLGDLKIDVAAALRSAGFEFDEHNPAEMRVRNENRYVLWNLKYGGVSASSEELRDYIQIETTFAPLLLPTVSRSVSSLIAEVYRRSPEVAAIQCVDPTETAAEKVVALTRRTAMVLAGKSRDPDPTLVRHFYDLHALASRIDMDGLPRLVERIVLRDGQEFKNQYPEYVENPHGETLRALDAFENDPIYGARFVDFQRAMVYGEKFSFPLVLDTVKRLAALVWPSGD